jgi:hypothetical protein
MNITIELSSIIKNLHQSSAGSGSKLNMAKFTLSNAQISKIISILAFSFTKSTNKFHTAIGHHKLFTASVLSILFFGFNIFETKFFISSKTSFD